MNKQPKTVGLQFLMGCEVQGPSGFWSSSNMTAGVARTTTRSQCARSKVYRQRIRGSHSLIQPNTPTMHAGNGAYHGSSAPAVSSKRMTYGSLSSQNREGRERQELFAGADPYRTPYQQQQQVPQEELNNEQLMRQAVAEHKDTTATAHRARQVRSGCPCCAAAGCGLTSWC